MCVRRAQLAQSMHSAPTPHTENMTPRHICALALQRYLWDDTGLLLTARYWFITIRLAFSEELQCSGGLRAHFFGMILAKQWHKTSAVDLWICQMLIYRPFTSHMAARNSPFMRNSLSLKSWGSICGNRLASAAIGGAPWRGLCVSTCLGEWMWVYTSVSMCVCVAETGWVEW